MRRETKLKKTLGFDKVVEVPAPIYLQAALMGLLDEMPKGYFYALPGAFEDTGTSYVRCARVDAALTHYVPTPLRVWNHYEESRAPIAINGGATRVLLFLRGLYRSGVPNSHYDGATRLMALYLEVLTERIETARDWNLDLDDFVAGQRQQPARDWMTEVLCSNVFELMIARHKDYKTG